MKNLHIKIVSYAEEKSAIQSVRYQVFQVEQGVDPVIEFDGLDEAAIHLMAYQDQQPMVSDRALPIATARIRYLSDTNSGQIRLAKIERVAVLAAQRGQGIGKEIMEVAIAFLAEKGIPEIKLNAQVYVCRFYEKLGFEQRGDVFDEAGIPHIEMRMQMGRLSLDQV